MWVNNTYKTLSIHPSQNSFRERVETRCLRCHLKRKQLSLKRPHQKKRPRYPVRYLNLLQMMK